MFCTIVLYKLIMTIIAPQWFPGQLMSMFIFLLILILGFLKFLSSNCPKQCQLYCPNIARSENQFWNANKPWLSCSPLSCPLYECKISSWHLFRLLTGCYRLTLKRAPHSTRLFLVSTKFVPKFRRRVLHCWDV